MKIKILLILINLTILIVLLTAGLWPFEFTPANNVHRLRDNTGLLLVRNNLVLEPKNALTPGMLSYLGKENRLTIEIRVKPYPATNNWLSYILCFHDGRDPELLVLGKWKSELILRRRVRRPSGEYAYHEVGAADALFPDKTGLITVAMDRAGTAVYVDGKEAAFFSRYVLRSNREELLKARVMIGNDPRARVPWEGEMLGLAVYRSALSSRDAARHYRQWLGHDYQALAREKDIIALYPMNEGSGRIIRNVITGRNSLMIPKYLFALKKTVLSRPWINFWKEPKFYSDIAINILGFIPLGFFLLALFVSHHQHISTVSSLTTILTGFIISLAIELVQVYMPGRSSSLADLICNTMGTIIGVVIFCKALSCKGGKLTAHLITIKQKKPD